MLFSAGRQPPLASIAITLLVTLGGLALFCLRDSSAEYEAILTPWTGYQAEEHRNRYCDPHDYPGILHLPEVFDSREGALDTFWQTIDPDICRPQEFVKRLARGESSSLPSQLHHRTILVIGDSIDRSNVEYTCRILDGDYTAVAPDTELWPQPEVTLKEPLSEGQIRPNEYSARSFPGLCHIKSIDLLLVNVFHFGLDEEDYFGWKDQALAPLRAEDRIRRIAVPLTEKLGRKVDIVEFASGLWDLARFGRIDDGQLTATDEKTLRHLGLERLQWFTQRYVALLRQVSDSFPSTLLFLARKLHIPADDGADSFQYWWQVPGGGSDGNKHTFYFPSWRVNEMNHAIDNALLQPENRKWQLDTWGDKLFGMELYEPGNVHPHYAATSVWIEQMLYRLANM